MKTQQFYEIMTGDLRFPEEIQKRINQLEEAKTVLIQAATGQLDSYDTAVFDPLLNLSNLQTDLEWQKKDIEKYLKE